MATPHRKSDTARWANRVIRNRTILIMFLLGVASFLVLFWKLYDLQIRRHDELKTMAISQQTRSSVISASRGTIYDRNGRVLAISATAETVNISPKEIAQFVEDQKDASQKAAEKAAAKGETYTAPRLRDQKYIAQGLARILEIDPATIEKRMERTYSMYETIQKKTEQTTADEIRRFISGEIDEQGREVPEKERKRLQGVWLQSDSKRYYPYSSLAAGIIGFVNGENKGGVGLESKYEDVLEGTTGLTVSAKNARGTEMLYQYEQYYDATDGSNLMLTIDTNVQYALEKGVRSMLDRYNAKNGGTGIIMNVNSGAIVAMVSYPNYDPNSYGTVIDQDLQIQLDKTLENLEKKADEYEDEEAYQAARLAAVNTVMQSQWRNKCVDSTYEPGSTFKPITLATALEEGVITMDSTFNCSGSTMVTGWDKPFYCSNHRGHGTQTLKVATGNSCNPAFINIGLKVGTKTYYKYLKAFGLMEPTGVDMIGEVGGIFASEKNFSSNVVSLASYSFGQTFNVTPLELIRAQAACVNGGYLYTPYVVEEILDDDGNILSRHDATPIRQVISEETSANVRECLEYVVASGTGKNGQVAGYRVGGKTGTADKTGTRDVVVSFMCFAPADDPEYIMLLTMDTPSRNTGVYVSGGNMVAPYASQIMGEVLPYLGIEPDFGGEVQEGADAAVPYVVGQSAETARASLESIGFSVKTVGKSDVVTDQTPAGGALVPNNATIILYLGEEKPSGVCIVPNVVGMTVSEANKAITKAGLIMRTAGVGVSDSSGTRAISQDILPDAELVAGDVVTVRFGDRNVLD